jgi:hypothetical protein
MKLLCVNSDSKTIKGVKYGFLTGILYLAPNIISGYQVCPRATAGCIAACLNTSGRGIYEKTQNGRIKKTKMFFENRAMFMETLHNDILALLRKAAREGLTPTVRLNGTSDIPWEKISYERNGVHYRSIIHAFPVLQFYDYTKIPTRHSVEKIPNYHLTFSLAENNDAAAQFALASGMNVAVVFNIKRTDKKPKKWANYPVIDGDLDDLRFIGKGGKIIGLSAKGKARHDASGFVREVTGGFNL